MFVGSEIDGFPVKLQRHRAALLSSRTCPSVRLTNEPRCLRVWTQAASFTLSCCSELSLMHQMCCIKQLNLGLGGGTCRERHWVKKIKHRNQNLNYFVPNNSPVSNLNWSLRLHPPETFVGTVSPPEGTGTKWTSRQISPTLREVPALEK